MESVYSVVFCDKNQKNVVEQMNSLDEAKAYIKESVDGKEVSGLSIDPDDRHGQFYYEIYEGDLNNCKSEEEAFDILDNHLVHQSKCYWE